MGGCWTLLGAPGPPLGDFNSIFNPPRVDYGTSRGGFSILRGSLGERLQKVLRVVCERLAAGFQLTSGRLASDLQAPIEHNELTHVETSQRQLQRLAYRSCLLRMAWFMMLATVSHVANLMFSPPLPHPWSSPKTSPEPFGNPHRTPSKLQT